MLGRIGLEDGSRARSRLVGKAHEDDGIVQNGLGLHCGGKGRKRKGKNEEVKISHKMRYFVKLMITLFLQKYQKTCTSVVLKGPVFFIFTFI